MTAAVLKYTVLRLALFVAAFAVLAMLGARPLLAVVLAAAVSMMLSYVLLRGPRDDVARLLTQRVQGRHGAREQRSGSRVAEDAAIEDAADDAARAGPVRPPDPPFLGREGQARPEQ